MNQMQKVKRDLIRDTIMGNPRATMEYIRVKAHCTAAELKDALNPEPTTPRRMTTGD